MGDLHCPARFVLVDAAGADGRWPALSAERIAAVFAAPDPSSAGAAARLAARLGVDVGYLDTEPAGDGPAVTGPDVLAELADRFRGETVAVVTPRVGGAAEAAEPAVFEYDEQGRRRG